MRDGTRARTGRVAVDAMADQRAAEAVAPGGRAAGEERADEEENVAPAGRIRQPVERDPVRLFRYGPAFVDLRAP
jgi:hypothetical protein